MAYEEKIINSVLHYRNSEKDHWSEVSLVKMTLLLEEERKKYFKLKSEYSDNDTLLSNIQNLCIKLINEKTRIRKTLEELIDFFYPMSFDTDDNKKNLNRQKELRDKAGLPN